MHEQLVMSRFATSVNLNTYLAFRNNNAAKSYSTLELMILMSAFKVILSGLRTGGEGGRLHLSGWQSCAQLHLCEWHASSPIAHKMECAACVFSLLTQVEMHMCTLARCFRDLVANSSWPTCGSWHRGWGPLF